jgi:hypothetical protein
VQRRGELAVLGVWPIGPLVPDKHGWALVIVEAKAEAGEAQGPFSLTLWEEEGTRKIVLDKVTFP